LCIPEWLGDIEDMIAGGGDALKISKIVEDNLTKESHVGGGTIFSLSAILSDLIELRNNQTNKDDVDQTMEFIEILLQSIDILIATCDGWQDIFNYTVRYQAATNYLMKVSYSTVFKKTRKIMLQC
jgi:hypothetical protein